MAQVSKTYTNVSLAINRHASCHSTGVSCGDESCDEDCHIHSSLFKVGLNNRGSVCDCWLWLGQLQVWLEIRAVWAGANNQLIVTQHLWAGCQGVVEQRLPTKWCGAS